MTLKAASRNRKSADARVPTTPPSAFNSSNRELTCAAAKPTATDNRNDDRRVAEREKESDADRPLALLHQLAGRIVDRGDMVGVDGVAQAERVGEERRAEEDRIVVQGEVGP